MKMNVENWWNVTGKGKQNTRRKISLLLCVPQISHVLASDRNRATALRAWWLSSVPLFRLQTQNREIISTFGKRTGTLPWHYSKVT